MEDTLLLAGSVPSPEVVASTSADGGRLALLAINKELRAAITAAIAVSGFVARPSHDLAH